LSPISRTTQGLPEGTSTLCVCEFVGKKKKNEEIGIERKGFG